MAFPKRAKALAIAKEVQGTDRQLGVMATNRIAWIDAAKISKECLRTIGFNIGSQSVW